MSMTHVLFPLLSIDCLVLGSMLEGRRASPCKASWRLEFYAWGLPARGSLCRTRFSTYPCNRLSTRDYCQKPMLFQNKCNFKIPELKKNLPHGGGW